MNPFLQLQEDTAARLAAKSFLAPIPMITEALGNVDNRINIALGKGGLIPGTPQPVGYVLSEAVFTIFNGLQVGHRYRFDPGNGATLAYNQTLGTTVALDFVATDSTMELAFEFSGTDWTGSVTEIFGGGLALLIITPKGRGLDNTRGASAQSVTVRVAIFVRSLINESARGLQKHPLEVQWSVLQQMLSWNRGPGTKIITLADWDSRENSNGELSYFADFNVPLVLTL